MERYSEQDIIETQEELLVLYPFLKKEEAKNIAEDMLQYWDYQLEKIINTF